MSPMPLAYLHLNYKAIRVQKMTLAVSSLPLNGNDPPLLIWKSRRSIVSSNAGDKYTTLNMSISWSMGVAIGEPNSRYNIIPSVQTRFHYASSYFLDTRCFVSPLFGLEDEHCVRSTCWSHPTGLFRSSGSLHFCQNWSRGCVILRQAMFVSTAPARGQLCLVPPCRF